jgi:hypothetical protein
MRVSSRGRQVKKLRLAAMLLVAWLLTALLLVTAAGCGSGGGATTAPPSTQVSTTSSTTASGAGGTQRTSATVPEVSAVTTTTLATTTSASTTSTTAASELSSAETRLSNGHIKAMGYVKRVWVDGTGRHLEIDYAEMLTGAAADAAAVAAGVIKSGEHMDNDYYISNVNPLLRTFSVSPSVDIQDTQASITWDTFMGYWTGAPSSDAALKREAPWWIERAGDVVVHIKQQFIP